VRVVHTKFQNAKIKIKERMVDNEVKFVLPRLWIQFTGVPAHLHDFLIIWAVGSILGVTKDVDMEFTRRHGISRLQVLMMNPNLIPRAVNIVIGDSLYELKFRVKMNAEVGAPHLMDIDDNHEADNSGNRKEDDVTCKEKQLIKGPKIDSGESARSGSVTGQRTGQGSAKSLPVFLIQVPPVQGQMGEGARGDEDSGSQGAGIFGAELGVHSVVKAGADRDLLMTTSKQEDGRWRILWRKGQLRSLLRWILWISRNWRWC
jgi:hypothetical protein